MIKTKHSKMGKRLIAAMKEVVDHMEGRTALPMRYVEVPEDVDVRAIAVQAGPVASGILTALCLEPALAPGMGARAQASRKRGARLLDGD